MGHPCRFEITLQGSIIDVAAADGDLAEHPRVPEGLFEKNVLKLPFLHRPNGDQDLSYLLV